MSYYREFWTRFRELPWWKQLGFVVFNVGGVSWASVAPFIEIYRGVQIVWLYVLWLCVTTLVASSLFVAGQRAWERVERARALLAERMKPKLQIVIGEDCCHLTKAARFGVANVGAESVRDVRIYADVDIVEKPIRGLLLGWAGEPQNGSITIHHGAPEDHHHTTPFVSVGDHRGEFWLNFAYADNNLRIPAGRYEARIVVKGEDTTAVVKRMEIRCEESNAIELRLLE